MTCVNKEYTWKLQRVCVYVYIYIYINIYMAIMWAQDGVVLENVIKIRTWEVEVMAQDYHET